MRIMSGNEHYRAGYVIDGNKANYNPFEWQNGLQFINVTNLEVSDALPLLY